MLMYMLLNGMNISLIDVFKHSNIYGPVKCLTFHFELEYEFPNITEIYILLRWPERERTHPQAGRSLPTGLSRPFSPRSAKVCSDPHL